MNVQIYTSYINFINKITKVMINISMMSYISFFFFKSNTNENQSFQKGRFLLQQGKIFSPSFAEDARRRIVEDYFEEEGEGVDKQVEEEHEGDTAAVC